MSDQQQRINHLEEKLRLIDDVKCALPAAAKLKLALKEAKLENEVLRGKLEWLCDKGKAIGDTVNFKVLFSTNVIQLSIQKSISDEDRKNEKDKLLKKYSHVKGKLSVLEKCPRATTPTPQPQATHGDPHDYHPKSTIELESDIARLRSDRDYYQKEYLRLISQTKNEAVRSHRCKSPLA